MGLSLFGKGSWGGRFFFQESKSSRRHPSPAVWGEGSTAVARNEQKGRRGRGPPRRRRGAHEVRPPRNLAGTEKQAGFAVLVFLYPYLPERLPLAPDPAPDQLVRPVVSPQPALHRPGAVVHGLQPRVRGGVVVHDGE